MFTGIIETLGKIANLKKEQGNLHITVEAPIVHELKIDQSVAHNGVCLTVVAVTDYNYTVTAIEETLNKTNLGLLNVGDPVNMERCMVMNARLDGHIVQGHVDQTAVCTRYTELDGSWEYTFEYDASLGNVTVEKGSICVNGISLTVVNSGTGYFSVAIIPYTYEHTNLHAVREGSIVNLEFDIIGKYVARLMNR
ncbi:MULTISPECIES: riboflavin synthase [unclassified Mucilaginibacter]|uniref:riboflavin synthase n=1 Tax=unclassified Mucilaginibacter TaxID=2617802 RepID=UPI0009641783|nr:MULTISPECIES: riboflavin synthase [unclassified Mucilaginibacter]HEK21296.1 riboflavin synthase [Bacteroidota bacterium]OJW18534.1 MAG: riboflavin synthase subunit alpha [Mucilaginibacter sp. 44-25]PLW90607.1 MAG: riboflavin synthase [Mucilaginibacter sp.]PLW91651.1 MAG: riboflavin synthase [Mucilaginibacter sp.]PMP64756.1 MAG: riboflavin synthase [Mucilaginibacter sp.]